VVSHDRAFLERTVEDVLVIDGHGSAARWAGGYADWEERRRAGRRPGTTRAAPAERSPAARPSDTAAKRRPADPAPADADAGLRSPSTLRHLVRDVEKEMAKLEKRRAALEAEVAGAAGAGDHQALRTTGQALAEVSAAHEAAEERWLELADELERAQALRRS
jgi:ATP-binding cassette subfamily F protein uup